MGPPIVSRVLLVGSLPVLLYSSIARGSAVAAELEFGWASWHHDVPPRSEEVLALIQLCEQRTQHCEDLIGSGRVYPGQPVDKFLEFCRPFDRRFLEEFTAFDFFPVPNYTGFTVVFERDKLVSARHWGDTSASGRVLFDTMSESSHARYDALRSAHRSGDSSK